MNSSDLLKKEFKKLQNKLLKVLEIENGLSGICPKYWLYAKNKKYLFKMPTNNDYSDFGEVFTSYLSYLLGYNAVKSIFHRSVFEDTEVYGSLIEDYRTKNVEETISLSCIKSIYGRRKQNGYTVNEALSLVKEFAEEKNLKIDKNLEQNLKEMALMDYLLYQRDRHANNIEFLIEKNKVNDKVIKLAPMFDNGFCLFLDCSSAGINMFNTAFKENSELDVCEKGFAPKFYIEYTEKTSEPYKAIIKDLATEILRNKPLQNLYNKFKELDFEKEIEFMCSIYKRELPLIYKETMIMAVKKRIKELDIELCKQCIKNVEDEVKEQF